MKFLSILACLAVILAASWLVIWHYKPWENTENPAINITKSDKEKVAQEKKPIMTEKEALDIALKAWGEPFPEGAPVEVKLEPKSQQYVVIVKAVWPKGTRGSDFHAKITIDSRTGEVIEVLGG